MTNTDAAHYHYVKDSHSHSPHTHTISFDPDVPSNKMYGISGLSVVRGNLPPLDSETVNTYLTMDRAEAMAEDKRIAESKPFADLLDEKVKAAEKSLAEKLNQALWGTYQPAITEQLRVDNPLLTKFRQEYPTKEQIMYIDTKGLIGDEVAKRKAKKAKAKVRKAYRAFDALGLDDADYAVWTWNHTFKGKDTVYEYVALYVNERWYVTGRTGPDGIDTDEFVGWLVGKEFDPETFVNVA